MSAVALTPATDPGAQGNPSGVESSSKDAPVCRYPGCTSHAVPGSLYCGDERHDSLGASKAATGTVTGVSDLTGALSQDGTGRSRRKPRRRSSDPLRRALGHHELRLDIAPTPGHVVVSGTAIVYDTRTVIADVFGKFGETIRPRAASHLIGGDVRLLANHDGLALARTTSKTLLLDEDQRGVHFAADLDVQGSPLAQDVVSGIRRGDLSGCSFAFTVGDTGDEWNEAMTERTIHRFASLPEISIVVFPAYPTTSVAARSQALELKRGHVLARRDALRRRRPHVTTQEATR